MANIIIINNDFNQSNKPDYNNIDLIMSELNLILKKEDIEILMSDIKYNIINCTIDELDSILDKEHNNSSIIYTEYKNIFDISKKLTPNSAVVKKNLCHNVSINSLNYLNKL